MAQAVSFNPRSVHELFVADSVSLGQVFLPVPKFSLIRIIPPMPLILINSWPVLYNLSS